VSFHQVTCPEPVHFAAQQVPNPNQDGEFLLRPWNVFSESHFKNTQWDDNPMKKPKEESAWRRYNPWVRIPDFILSQVSSKEIDEILDLKTAGLKPEKADLVKRYFAEQKSNLMFLRKWRLIFAKMLWAKLIFFFYLYNNALEYFLEVGLQLPKAMQTPFGEKLGEAIGSDKNQIYMYALLALWLTIALQLVVTAAAREYRDHWLSSVICYAFGLPLLMSFMLTFVAMHKPSIIPPFQATTK